jgi:hypothetical protein
MVVSEFGKMATVVTLAAYIENIGIDDHCCGLF